MYPNIDFHCDIFADPTLSRSIFDTSDALDRKSVERLFREAIPAIAEAERTDYYELAKFSDCKGIAVFLPSLRDLNIQDWSEDGREFCAADFCSHGNGLVLPGAYWTQYTDMNKAAIYADIIRNHIGELRGDACEARAVHMAQHEGDLKIAIHIRRSDSSHWYGGIYFHAVEEYIAIIKYIHRSLMSIPHVFYVFSENDYSSLCFDDLPVFYQRADYIDDFVAMGRCDIVVGPPSTFATWSAFLGGAKRLIITRERIASLSTIPSFTDLAVDIPFPTGGYLPGDTHGRPI